MLLLIVIFLQITFNFLTNGELQPPKIDTQILSAKLNRTGMYESKIKELMRIFDNSTTIAEQSSRANKFISSMSNAKVNVYGRQQSRNGFVKRTRKFSIKIFPFRVKSIPHN
ncbi:hypothetical protein GCK32_013347 [Trichostrongylus colubriformis]|uniref:Uncharacterized protein n=1 Tax=Trichostrongylus colubriformis TaxID=6319 RepID=A0AAN8FE84_TRICO